MTAIDTDSQSGVDPGPQNSAAASRLGTARLHVLITESLCRHSWKDVVKSTLQGGADVLQLREKSLPDDEIVDRCRWLTEACESFGAICILNDRPDLAAKGNAHGVHIGQSDGEIVAARQMLNAGQIVGVSTHDNHQVDLACRQGADYLGVGPVFPSRTKSFGDFPGLSFVSDATKVADRPWFAIGGISKDNLRQAIDAGCERIAVCGAVIGAKDPELAAGELRQMLTTEQSQAHTNRNVMSPKREV